MRIVILARNFTPAVMAVARSFNDVTLVLEAPGVRQRWRRRLRRWKRDLASLRPAMLLHPWLLARLATAKLRPGRATSPAAELGRVRIDRVPDHNGPECLDILQREAPDVIFVQSTRILKPHVFRAATRGAINFHKGLLPYWRGSDIPLWALREDAEQGFTLHWIDEGCDTGDIICREVVPVEPGDGLESIRHKLETAGARRIVEVLKQLEGGPIESWKAGSPGPMHRRYSAGDRFELEARRHSSKKPSQASRPAPSRGSR